MATKKGKKKFVLVLALIGVLFALKNIIYTMFVFRGTWQGRAGSKLLGEYAGLRIDPFTGKVTVSSRADLVGTYSNGAINWTNGTKWMRE